MFTRFKKYVKKEKVVKRYFILFVTMFVGALNYNLFLGPLKIVAGGTNGLSILMEELIGMEPSLFILIFSVIVFVISIFIVGFEKSSSALVATFVYPWFVELTKGIMDIVQFNQVEVLLLIIVSGVLSGWVSGATCKVDLSQGGITLVSQMLYEKFKISISKTNFIINTVIIIVGGLCFGPKSVLYAITMLYVSSIIIDRVLLGISKQKTLYIISNKNEEIIDIVLKEQGYGLTVFNSINGKTNEKNKVIMTTVLTKDYIRIRDSIKKLDEKVFLLITDSYQTIGGKIKR